MPHNTFATSGPSLVGHTLDNGRLEFLSILGTGAYGVVYLAVDLHAPTPVYLAIKCLLRAGLDSRQRHFQRREIALHQLASRHPNVVTLHKVIEEGDYIFVVMDFCDEGDLFGMITERQRYIGDDELIKKVFLQIVDAVDYCHSMGIFHRDLKPENILCSKDGSRICIADFGLATSERYSTDFGCGSTFYLSPECQGGIFERLDKYNTATNDLWSLGVILVNLTCGRNPWRQATPSDETFRAFVHNADFLQTILPISDGTHKILKGLFALEPRDRPSLREVRRQILAIDTFTMTEDELRTAHSAARAAAAAVRPIPPAAPAPASKPKVVDVNPKPLPTPKITQRKLLFDEDEDMDMSRPDRVERASSVFSLASEVLDAIDFSTQAAGPSTPASKPRLHVDTHQLGESPLSTPASLPQLDSSEQVPYPLETTSSRSSSSGDGSLPPTPEFAAADKTNPNGQLTPPQWDLGAKAKVNARTADLLHVSVVPLSPINPDIEIV